ncbi:hypothetical protein ABQ38_001171 [Salmonella enterica subsp. enterica serovar Sandiego]|nr:hypothetical protein [Salmonella enterica subsp. enterica serovar Sandiego]
MFYVDNNSGSPTMPALSPAQSNTPTWFTEGDRNKGISHIGQDWLNILQAELLNILSEAGIKPDKGKLNQLTLSIKAIITANACTQANNLKEIFDAGIEAQAAARSHLGLGKLATKDSLGPTDVSALAKDQNLNDVPDKAKARQSLQLGNSATCNVGASAKTVAAGDDIRITASKKAIDDTQIGLAAQSVMWITSADDLSNLPSGARRFATNKAPATVLPAAGYFFLEVLAKRDTANGSCILATSDAGDVWIGLRYTVPGEAAFTWTQLNQNVQNLGLTEAVNRALNAVQKTGDIMTGNLTLRSDERMHIVIQNADGSARAYFYKDKGGDGVRLSNGVDGGGDFVFGKNGEFYSPSYIHIGGAVLSANGDTYGSVWGNQYISAWLNNNFAVRDNNINIRATWDWVNQNFITSVRYSAERQVGAVGVWTYHSNTVLTGFNNVDGDFSAETLFWSEIQIYKNGAWLTIGR